MKNSKFHCLSALFAILSTTACVSVLADDQIPEVLYFHHLIACPSFVYDENSRYKINLVKVEVTPRILRGDNKNYTVMGMNCFYGSSANPEYKYEYIKPDQHVISRGFYNPLSWGGARDGGYRFGVIMQCNASAEEPCAVMVCKENDTPCGRM